MNDIRKNAQAIIDQCKVIERIKKEIETMKTEPNKENPFSQPVLKFSPNDFEWVKFYGCDITKERMEKIRQIIIEGLEESLKKES